jgi:regulator of sigma E protease
VVISLNLGIMNLIPFPGLDGSRLVFLTVEAIRRKPVPADKEGMVHAIGLMLLFALIIFITYKDIIRLFTGG